MGRGGGRGTADGGRVGRPPSIFQIDLFTAELVDDFLKTNYSFSAKKFYSAYLNLFPTTNEVKKVENVH